MLYSLGNVVPISFGKTTFFTINHQLYLAFHNDSHLGSMRVLRQIDSVLKLHEQYLVCV